MKKLKKKSSIKKKVAKRTVKKKARGGILPTHYSSIDSLPIYLWNEVRETGDVTHLLIKQKKVSNKILIKLTEVWKNILDQYLKVFGLSESYKDELRKKLEIAQMRIQKIINDELTLETAIDIEELELAEMQSEAHEKFDLDKTTAYIEINITGFQINVHTTSVKKYYSYLKKSA